MVRFRADLDTRTYRAQIAADTSDARSIGVSGTPTFFVNGRRHYGAYDIGTLSDAVRAAGARATLATVGSDDEG